MTLQKVKLAEGTTIEEEYKQILTENTDLKIKLKDSKNEISALEKIIISVKTDKDKLNIENENIKNKLNDSTLTITKMESERNNKSLINPDLKIFKEKESERLRLAIDRIDRDHKILEKSLFEKYLK